MRASLRTGSALPRCLAAWVVAAIVAPVAGLPPAAARVDPGPEPSPAVSQVVVISLDGLTPRALTRLGEAGTPVLHRMMRDGASTLNARTRLRADGDAAQPHEHGHRPPDRRGRRRSRRDLERRPHGPAPRCRRPRAAPWSRCSRPSTRPAGRPRSSRRRPSSRSGSARGPTPSTATRSASTPTAPSPAACAATSSTTTGPSPSSTSATPTWSAMPAGGCLLPTSTPSAPPTATSGGSSPRSGGPARPRRRWSS